MSDEAARGRGQGAAADLANLRLWQSALRRRGTASTPGRQMGQRPSERKAKRVRDLHREELSYRLIGRNLGLSKNTVMDIVKRAGATP